MLGASAVVEYQFEEAWGNQYCCVAVVQYNFDTQAAVAADRRRSGACNQGAFVEFVVAYRHEVEVGGVEELALPESHLCSDHRHRFRHYRQVLERSSKPVIC